MNTLPNEIISHIFDYIILITDKRQFLRTCVLYNKITKHSMEIFEIKFSKHGFDYCIEKFTLELCHDKYFDMIPTFYINPDNKVIVRALAEFNCLPLLKVARNNGCDLTDICNYISDLDTLKWARANNYKWNENFCSRSAARGHLDTLKWARENGCPWDAFTCSGAANGGHLHILKWARENGCIWTARTCTNAARKGHLHILRWARNNGCNWDINVCRYAANYGHLHILQWAIENGCEWDKYICSLAAINGHFEVLKWALANGCEWEFNTYIEEIEHENIVKWIKDNGYA